MTRLALPPLDPPPPVTLICALALLPLLVTVIVALPDATPVTRPVASTLAIELFDDVQENFASGTALPLASFALASRR